MGNPSPRPVSTKLQRIADIARSKPGVALTTLAHHIDVDFLAEAWRLVRKDGAVGIDGVTAADYGQNLRANLADLLDRFKSGRYRAPPVRRVYIPKGDGSKTRPIGIPTLEDKILQKAVAMVLEAVYEQDFSNCSYGFRPGRSAHQALDTLWRATTWMRGGWVLDVDIERFFGTLDHRHLRAFLDRRIRDGVLRRAIGKWLKAGVVEGGELRRSIIGSPQGGVISPLLANIYLHVVLDEWFEQVVQPRLRGRSVLIRYADDFVLVCEHEYDARRVMDVLPRRLGRFGLTVHPEKTRLVRFERPGGDDYGRATRPGTFDFLGFTHYWGRSRKGRPLVKRKTASSRISRATRAMWTWCRNNRHLSIAIQHRTLCRKLEGHYAYYGITGNSKALACVRDSVRRAWRKWLGRRGGKVKLTWQRFERVLRRFPLPHVRVVHSIYRQA